MSYNGGEKANYPHVFLMPQIPPQPQSMEHPRMNMVPHSMAFPPPTMLPQFQPNMKYVQPIQPGIHPQAQYYPDDRGGQIFYSVPQQLYNRPPPQHFIQNPSFIQQQSIDAVAEQVKNVSQPVAGPHPVIPPLQQMSHQIPHHMAHQGIAMMHPNQMHHPHYQRQHYSQNSLSRGQTPTTASHSGSKRSSPQNLHQADPTNLSQQQEQDDYTPPGTPQELTPITDDQKQQYIASLGQAGTDKGVEMMVSKLKDTHFDGNYDPSNDGRKSEHTNDSGIFDKPMEFFNKNFQNHDSKDWQHNLRVGENPRHDHNFGGNPNYNSYNGRNDRQMRNQQPQPRQGRNAPSRPSQDARLSNQQRGVVPNQRFQQVQQQSRPIGNQWRSNHAQNDVFVQPQMPEPAHEPEHVVECGYCRMLGKSVSEYSSHIIRNLDGKAVCPEIKKLVCPICNATGESAHTEYFCPKTGRTGHNDLVKTAQELRAYLESRKQQPQPLNQNHQQPIRPQQHYHNQPYHGGGRRH